MTHDGIAHRVTLADDQRKRAYIAQASRRSSCAGKWVTVMSQKEIL